MFHTNDEKQVTETVSPGSKSVKKASAISGAKKSSRSASFDSSDSDSDNESRHLSLKHISNSVKRISEEKQKNVQKFPKLKPKVSESESEQEAKKTPKTKQECDKCKKKFSNSMALEYHKITFHVTSEASSPSAAENKTGEKAKKRKSLTKPSQNLKKQKTSPNKTDTNKSKCLTGIFRKTQKQSDLSEDDSKQVIETIKSTLSMMHKRTFTSFNSASRVRQSINYKDNSSSSSDSDSDEEPMPPKDARKGKGTTQRKNISSKSRVVTKKRNKAEVTDESSSEDEPLAKKVVKKGPKRVPHTIESEFQSHSIDAMLRSKDDQKGAKKVQNKNVSKQVKPTVDSKAAKVTSDSEPEIVKKEIKTEPVVDIVDSEDESSKIRERLFSTTNVKEKCEKCNKNFKNLLTLRYHQLHCDVSSKSTSSTSKNSVEKNILQIKKSSESPADKILKKLSEKVLKPDTKSAQTQVSKPKVKQCGVKVKKISKGEMKKFEDDIEKKAKPTPPRMKEKPNSSKVRKPTVKASTTSVKNLKQKKPVAAKTVSSPGTGVGGGTRVRCDQCGKKYADSLALEYHKITFHVGEEETKLFSTSLYNEQMNFDQTVLKLNEQEATTLISDSAKSPKPDKRKPSIEAEKKPGKSGREASKQEKKKVPIKKVNTEKVKSKKVLEKAMEKAKPKTEALVGKLSSGYCICDKPEREDMLG